MSAIVNEVYTKDFSRKFWGWIFLSFVIDIAKTRLVVFLEAGWGVALFAIRAGLSNPPYRDAVDEWIRDSRRLSEGPAGPVEESELLWGLSKVESTYQPLQATENPVGFGHGHVGDGGRTFRGVRDRMDAVRQRCPKA